MISQPLDLIPLWGFFVLATFSELLALEGGYQYGKWRHSHAKDEKDAPVAAMVAALLGLLAFMLAFTFSLAATRFDDRRQAMFDESKAIGTTYLRARLLPEPQRSEIVNLLRRYTELRVQYIAEGKISELLAESEELHEQLWSGAVAAAEIDPHSILTGLFLQSLNETIDLHSKRVFVGLQSQIPLIIWLALFSLTLLGMASIGYQSGLSAARHSPEMPVLMVAFAGVLCLIVDLDRPRDGLLQVSQQPTIDVLRTMQSEHP